MLRKKEKGGEVSPPVVGERGLVYVFTGEGKGKTSAALGVSVRALLSGKKVCWIAWYKEPSWQMSEAGLVSKFEDSLEMHFMGRGFYMQQGDQVEEVVVGERKIKKARVGRASVFDTALEEEHLSAARSASSLARAKMGQVWLLVLDEVLNAIDDGLVKEEELMSLLEARGKTHVVLTGRSRHLRIERYCDLVSKIEKVKHPYDKGVLAVFGLDF